jgi:nitric oxide synthase-interacting protein
MPRHSKNSTNRALFTYDEYKNLDYGTQRVRLGRDSLRSFDACNICLQQAIEPVCCTKGHLYCKECIYNSILEQKKEIMKEEKEFQEELAKQQAELSEKSQHEKSKEIETFLTIQKGIQLLKSKQIKESIESNRVLPSNEDSRSQENKKRKIVSCMVDSHPISLRKLFPVYFTQLEEEKQQIHHSFICPACRKILSNSGKMFILPNCGHVFCKLCIEKLIQVSQTCLLCDKKCKAEDSIPLKHEGK